MTDGVLTALDIRPGFQKNNTPYTSEAEWIDGDKVRFKFRYPEKIGGWVTRDITSAAPGVPRAIHAWADLQGQKILAVGTNRSLAIYFSGSDYLDITPSNFEGGLATNLASFGYGSGPYGGDYPPLADVSAASDVTSILDAGTSISGVTSIDLGYGESPSSVSSGSGLSQIKLVEWSLDNFGEDLIAVPRGGNIYRWDRSSVATTVVASVTIGINPVANAINNAPTKVNTAIISEPAPYLVAFGTCTQTGPFDPLLVRWSDLENFADWEASAQNTAGDFRIQGGSEIVAVQKTKRETLVVTDDVVYSMQFVGGSAIFDFERLAANSGAISQHCMIDVNGIVYWMSDSNFIRYSGVVEPLETPLDEAIFDRSRSTSLNFFQKEKVYAGINSEFNEIWWLYPSRDSLENDRYVIYNYLENLWYDGTIDRTAWTDGDIFELPIAAYGTSVSGTALYDHESGKNDNDNVMTSWIKSGSFDIDDGDKLLFINRVVPDFTALNGPIELTVIGRKYPQAAPIFKGPYTITQTTRKNDIRLRARQMQFTVSSSTLDGDWELGTLRANIRPDGER